MQENSHKELVFAKALSMGQVTAHCWHLCEYFGETQVALLYSLLGLHYCRQSETIHGAGWISA